jgi:hypothetical protein
MKYYEVVLDLIGSYWMPANINSTNSWKKEVQATALRRQAQGARIEASAEGLGQALVHQMDLATMAVEVTRGIDWASTYTIWIYMILYVLYWYVKK